MNRVGKNSAEMVSTKINRRAGGKAKRQKKTKIRC